MSVDDSFEVALKEVLLHEGGYVNNPKDPGGMTNLGVTRDTWSKWTGIKDVSEREMRSLTVADVATLYRENYWLPSGCDRLPRGLALCVFDFSVNAGPSRAVRYLQTMAGSPRDGVFGPLTLSMTQSLINMVGEDEAIRRYQQGRRIYYRQLSTFKVFGRGWLRRVNEIESKALREARG